MKSKNQNNTVVTPFLIGLFCMLVTSNRISAQQTISTAAQLKAACETNAGNQVIINQSTKIADGTASVNCGCTMVLTNGASLDFENLNMDFAGPLVIRSAQKGELKLTNKSWVTAYSININLAGVGSSLATTESNLNALAGNLDISLGEDAKMELAGLNFSGGSAALSATGSIRINGGRKFTGSFEGKGSHFPVRATQSIYVKMSGGEGILKMERVAWWASEGSIAITATGAKSSLELNNGFFSIDDSFHIRFEGAESLIKMNQLGLDTDEGGLSNGGLIIEAGTGNAANGKIEVSGLGTREGDIAFITMAASRNGQNGSVKVERNNIVAAGGNLIIETGASGSTEVKDSRLVSSTRIRIATGAGGNCVAQANGYFAPVQELCGATVIAPAQKGTAITEATMPVHEKTVVYPNPTSNGVVNVSVGNMAGAVDVLVVDLTGRVLRQWRSVKNNTLVIHGLAVGVYSLKIIDHANGKQRSERFVVIGR